MSSMQNLLERVEGFERQLVAVALAQAHGNITRAAEDSGITFRQMRYLVKKHRLKEVIRDAARA